MIKAISEEHSKIIFKEMFDRVGARIVDINTDSPSWYMSRSWTLEEQKDFQKWLGEKLVEWGYARKGKYRGQNHGYYEAGKIVMNYGWTIKWD